MSFFSQIALRRRLTAGALALTAACLVSPTGAAAPIVLHSFAPANAQQVNTDGDYPSNGVTQGSDGEWYGITGGGGPAGAGALFKMNPDGTGFTVLKTFDGNNQNVDGGYPGSPLRLGSDGALYGTTSNGGANGDGNSSPGTIFRVSPTGQFQTLFSFPTYDADAAHGGGQVFQASDGVLYGSFDVKPGFLFRMNANGTGYQTIHTFAADNNDGSNVGGGYPEAISVEGTDGYLYGVAASGGAHGGGTVFKIAKDGTGFTVLHDFNGANPQDGATPSGDLRKGLDGALYGITSQGGANNTGTVYRVTQAGAFQQIVSFPVLPVSGVNTAGANPSEEIGLAQGPDGTLYGTTNLGGANGHGTLFAVKPDGSGLTDLFDFRAANSQTISGASGNLYEVTFGSNGLLYITTNGGGANGSGAILALAPPQRTQMLWTNTNGQAALWQVKADGTYASAVYGPFAGWTARAVSDGPDGTAHLLWTNTNGTASVWNISATGYTSRQFGPYSGWAAVSLATAPAGGDGTSRLLWDNTNGQAAFWNLNTATGAFSPTQFGPYSGWTAKAVSMASDEAGLLWTNVNGQAAAWAVLANGTAAAMQVYGPYSGWTAQAIASGELGDEGRLLWDNSNGTASLWTPNLADGTFTYTAYGPFGGWSARAVATGGDDVNHLLWDNVSGQASLWTLTGSGYTSTQYGPFSGWTAVALSAGP